MPVSSKMYGQAVRGLFSKQIDFLTDDVKVMLLQPTYTPDQDAHDFVDDVVAHEFPAGNGYIAGGLSLAGKTMVYDAATNTVTLDCDDISWPASTITARYAVFYVDTAGAAAADPLLWYWDFGSDFTSAGDAFTLTVSPSGLLTAVVA